MVSLSPLMGERQAKDLFRILWQREGDASGVNLLNFAKIDRLPSP